jgi:hypothetical protein
MCSPSRFSVPIVKIKVEKLITQTASTDARGIFSNAIKFVVNVLQEFLPEAIGHMLPYWLHATIVGHTQSFLPHTN